MGNIISSEKDKDLEKQVHNVLETGSTALSLRRLDLTTTEKINSDKLKHLTAIDLGSNKIKFEGVKLDKFRNLVELHLSRNRLNNLPEYFNQLKQLSILVMKDNHFTTIPVVIFDLIKLEQLDFESNRIAQLPTSISKLTALKILNLNNNILSTVPPDSVGKLRKLNELGLSSNNIKDIPNDLRHCTSLGTLNLSKNKLKRIHSGVLRLPGLKFCLLNNNEIETFPKEYCTQMIQLDLRYNMIIDIPEDIRHKNAAAFLSDVPDCIAPKFFLGPNSVSTNKNVLRFHHITHILRVKEDQQPEYPKEFVYKVVKEIDSDVAQLSKHFYPCIEFIDKGVAAGGCLLHCQYGKSRSATIAIAYFMYKNKMMFKEALEYVKSKRPVINPNRNFIQQLLEFEKTLFGEKGGKR